MDSTQLPRYPDKIVKIRSEIKKGFEKAVQNKAHTNKTNYFAVKRDQRLLELQNMLKQEYYQS